MRVADFAGRPHFYQALYLDAESDELAVARFELSPVSGTVRDLAVEAFLRWQRWQVASFAGTAPALGEDAPRVLPQDRARYEDLQSALGRYLRIDPAQRVVMFGEFTGRSAVGRPLSGLSVRWTAV